MIPGRAASIRFALVVCACLSLSACSRKVTAPAATDLNAGVKAENSSQPASPFTLEIVEDLNDGSNLHIHGRVQTAAEWPAEDVVVRLSGMKAGESHQVSFFPLNKLQQRQADAKTTNRLVPGTPFDFYLSAPSSELTDYQVELLWGKEAKGVSATEPPADPTQAQGLLLQALSIQRVIPHCAVEPCPSTYRLSGSFLNNSATTVQDAQLGVGFVWVPKGAKLDLSTQIPQDEETVEITGLNLAPQQSRPFKLNIDRVVPELPDGSFQPVVRVISARTESK